MRGRYLICGPKNSGKSSYTLALRDHLISRGIRAEAVELDVWGNSFGAFAGETSFEARPKRTGTDWPWKEACDERLARYNGSEADVVLGDIPGYIDDETTGHLLRAAENDGAIIISSSIEGIVEWRAWLESQGVKVVEECLSARNPTRPFVLRDMNRTPDPEHPDVSILRDIVTGGEQREALERVEEERFETLFKLNYMHRSRTAHGRDQNIDGPEKKPLLLTGQALKLRTMENWKRLLEDVRGLKRPSAWTAGFFRDTCERWFAIANRGIYATDHHRHDFDALRADAELVARARGTAPRVNPRYRLWIPKHTLMKVPPLLLEEEMDRCYGRLAELAERAESRAPSWKDTLEVMVYADMMMDGELRPWLDGCGRIAVTLVMWLARTLGAPLPLFDESKEVHKLTMRDFDRHVSYFIQCIRHAETTLA